ncbi:MAG: Na/Pi cotransporter family protein [Betaproteobacteria bacterium]
MQHLLNLLAAIALLVWGTHIVRTGILRVLGANLRRVLSNSVRHRVSAAAAGLGVTAMVQSSAATGLIVSSFVAHGVITLSAALAIMLGADIGTSLMTVVFSFDLSWLSPLLIFCGVVLFISRQATTAGQSGRVLIGIGLIILALQLIVQATQPLMQSASVKMMLTSLTSDVLLDMTVGAALTLLAYSSLAIVLLTATLATSGVVPLDVAFGLVLGANLGSGIMALITTAKSPVEARRVPLGNFLFKLAGCLATAPFLGFLLREVPALQQYPQQGVVLFHLALNTAIALGFLMFTETIARRLEAWWPTPDKPGKSGRPHHLDPVALATPSLAISCAAREALHQADVVETMLNGILPVIRNNDLKAAEELCKLDDTVDELYSAIKYYMTKISREALEESESRRWTDIISFTINMEQVGDIIERVLIDIQDKKIKPQRNFSEAGMAEISDLHARLVDNLRLGMSVFLNGNLRDAQKLLEEKARFRDLERSYAGTHLERLSDNTPSSIETSSLHIDLISELRRINSHICSIAYPILESAGVLASSRLKTSDI